MNKQVVIIGGGLAGLTAAVLLGRRGINTLLIEKKKYPFHRVCGEYVSMEVSDFLIANGMDYRPLNPAYISQLHLSSPSGNSVQTRLGMGAFGLSRYTFDNFLMECAKSAGVEVWDGEEVEGVLYEHERFEIKTKTGKRANGEICLGAFGKRSLLDHALNREFISEKSGYVGVKMHYEADYPVDQVGMHNFRGGYAGISNVEGRTVNLCYMTHADYFKEAGDFQGFEEKVLRSNPHLRQFLNKARPLFEKPLVISQMFFGEKQAVKDHVLYCGDAAGAVAPLTGNGMAMAIASGKKLAEEVISFLEGRQSRSQMEASYSRFWKNNFSRRITLGNVFQPVFGRPTVSNLVLKVVKLHSAFLPFLISKTHGKKLE